MVTTLYTERNPNEPTNPFRRDVDITFKPLTQEIAENFGNVSWVEHTDPVQAIRAMFSAVSSAPYGCAVWPQSRQIDDHSKELLRDWRRHDFSRSLDAEPNPYRHPPKGPIPSEQIMLLERIACYLRDRHERTNVVNLHTHGLSMLQRMTDERTKQIYEALPGARVSLDLRTDSLEEENLDAHFDGGSKTYRLVETFTGSTTVLFDQIETQTRLDKKNEPYCSVVGDQLTAWMTPAQSLTLLTTKMHHSRIAHGTPIKTSPWHSDDDKRIVAVYTVMPA